MEGGGDDSRAEKEDDVKLRGSLSGWGQMRHDSVLSFTFHFQGAGMLVRIDKHLIKLVRYIHPPLVNLNTDHMHTICSVLKRGGSRFPPRQPRVSAITLTIFSTPEEQRRWCVGE